MRYQKEHGYNLAKYADGYRYQPAKISFLQADGHAADNSPGTQERRVCPGQSAQGQRIPLICTKQPLSGCLPILPVKNKGSCIPALQAASGANKTMLSPGIKAPLGSSSRKGKVPQKSYLPTLPLVVSLQRITPRPKAGRLPQVMPVYSFGRWLCAKGFSLPVSPPTHWKPNLSASVFPSGYRGYTW